MLQSVANIRLANSQSDSLLQNDRETSCLKCNISDHASLNLEIMLLRHKLHSVTAPSSRFRAILQVIQQKWKYFIPYIFRMTRCLNRRPKQEPSRRLPRHQWRQANLWTNRNNYSQVELQQPTIRSHHNKTGWATSTLVQTLTTRLMEVIMVLVSMWVSALKR